MTGPLAVSAQRVAEMSDATLLEMFLRDANLVAVSGVLQKDLNAPRFSAILKTLDASWTAGVPHLIMLDNDSHSDVASILRNHGGIVIDIDHETEGGLARPYVIAAQLMEEFAPEHAVMVKFEGEKAVFADSDNVGFVLDACRIYDVASGVRTMATWVSMPPFQVLTEYWLGMAIGDMLGVSNDTPSGVIALTGEGRRFFIESVTDNHWSYLFGVPHNGLKAGLRIGSFEVNFCYADEVVAEETGNPVYDQKRLDQIDQMLDRARSVCTSILDDATAVRLSRFRQLLQLQVGR
jgi:hypothetical protein